LFKAAEITGNQTLIDIAISHADKTIVNHIRPDGMYSSLHTKLSIQTIFSQVPPIMLLIIIKTPVLSSRDILHKGMLTVG
jgi:hypothetical protein